MSRITITEVNDVINHPVEQAWSLISAFGSIKAWMPTIISCTVSGIGIGAVRKAHSFGAPKALEEELVIWDEKSHILSYRFLDPTGLPMSGGYAVISLKATDEGKTIIIWRAEAEEITAEGLEMTRSLMQPFIKTCVRGINEALGRSAQAADSA